MDFHKHPLFVGFQKLYAMKILRKEVIVSRNEVVRKRNMAGQL